jgi:hypothetical protein
MKKELSSAVPDAATAHGILRGAAGLSTLFGVLYFLGLMGKLIVNGSIHATSSQGISMLSAVIGLLWDVTLVTLFVALRRQTRAARAIYADLGVVFIALMAGVSGINWYTQLMLVPRLSPTADAALLALLDVHNLNSLLYAMEHLAWGLFFGLAAVCMGLTLEGGKLESWTRWLLIASGVLSLLYLPGWLLNSAFLIDLGYYAAGLLLPAASVLIFLRYRKTPGR